MQIGGRGLRDPTPAPMVQICWCLSPPPFLEFEKFVGQVCSLWNSGILGDPNVCMSCLLCLGSEGAGFEGNALHKLPSSSTPACFGLAGKDNASLSDVHHVGELVGWVAGSPAGTFLACPKWPEWPTWIWVRKGRAVGSYVSAASSFAHLWSSQSSRQSLCRL